MANQGMLSVAQSYLRENKKTSFNQLWNEILKQLKPVWKKENPHVRVPELESIKRAQFYKLLTLDGRFLRLRDSKWILVEEYSFEEANSLRVFYDETATADSGKD